MSEASILHLMKDGKWHSVGEVESAGGRRVLSGMRDRYEIESRLIDGIVVSFRLLGPVKPEQESLFGRGAVYGSRGCQ